MNRFFLKIKYWQLILLPMAISLVFCLFAGTNPTVHIYLTVVLFLIFGTILYAWLYSLGVNLHRLLPPTVKMRLIRFKNSIYIIFVYFFCFSIFFVYSITNFIIQITNKIQISKFNFKICAGREVLHQVLWSELFLSSNRLYIRFIDLCIRQF